MPTYTQFLAGIRKCLDDLPVDQRLREDILLRAASEHHKTLSQRQRRYAEKIASGWTRPAITPEQRAKETARRRLARAKLRAAGLPYT